MSNQLLNEINAYKLLQGGFGIPQYLGNGINGDARYLVLELLGPSLEDLLHFCKKPFNAITCLSLGEQMVISHLDIKNWIYSFKMLNP